MVTFCEKKLESGVSWRLKSQEFCDQEYINSVFADVCKGQVLHSERLLESCAFVA